MISLLTKSTLPGEPEMQVNIQNDGSEYDDATKMNDERPRGGWDVPGLTWFDVFSLIVNKMIGTGIFTTPASVFLLTGQKTLTLGLWAVGFFYTMVSTALYLDYATVFPFTGGELIYIEEMSAWSGIDQATGEAVDAKERAPHATTVRPSKMGQFLSPVRRITRRIFGDGLLGLVVYAVIFVGLFNSSTNSMQFGKMILVAIQADAFAEDAYHELNRDLIRFIAVAALSVTCLVQFFSPVAGRRLNNLAAVVKVLFVLLLIIFGAVAASKRQKQPGDWTEKNCMFSNATYSLFPLHASCCLDQDTVRIPQDSDCFLNNSPGIFKKKVSGVDPWAWAKALLLVLFSFQGWENATFVAGEIPQHGEKKNVLRRGFMTAVIVVGILYLCAVAVFLDAFPYDKQLETAVTLNYASYYTPARQMNNGTEDLQSPSAASIRAWAIIIAISCLGSLNSVIYTFSRVKQAIGQANILPWSNIWRKSHILSKEQRDDDIMNQSPQGGLISHWLMSVIFIAAVSSIDATTESILLPGYFQAYAHAFVLLIMAAVFPRLGGRAEALQRDRPDHRFQLWQPRGAGLAAAATILLAYAALNAAILVVVPQVSLTSDVKGRGMPGPCYAAVVFGLVALALAYYVCVLGDAAAEHVERQPGGGGGSEPEVVGRAEGLFGSRGYSLLGLAGVRCRIRKDLVYDIDMERVRHYGRRWRAVYVLREDLRPQSPGDAPSLNILYWLFGGKWYFQHPETDTPWERFLNWLPG